MSHKIVRLITFEGTVVDSNLGELEIIAASIPLYVNLLACARQMIRQGRVRQDTPNLHPVIRIEIK